jgi:hypothetical protein
MQIPVLIEPIDGNGYRATGGPPLAVAEASLAGRSRPSLPKCLRLLAGRLAARSRRMKLQSPPKEHNHDA